MVLSIGRRRKCTNDNGSAYNIIGIGKLKAANIVYRAESVYFTSTTNYAQARAATIKAAEDMYGINTTDPLRVALAWYAVGVGSNPLSSHNIVGQTQLTPGYAANYSLSTPYYNATNYVWTIPSGCAYNYCWAILSGQETSNISIRAGSIGTKTITCRAYAGNNLLGSQYITVNVQDPNSGGGGTSPCGGALVPLYGVIYPPNPCSSGGLVAETTYFKHIVIYDIFGRIVKQASSVEQISTDDLHNGVYIVRATLNNDRFITQKIVK